MVGAALVVLYAVSIVLNAISLFLVPQYVDGHAGVSVLIVVVGNLLLGGLAAWGLQRPAGPFAVALGWVTVFGIVSTVHPGGDVILAGSLAGDHTIVTVGTIWVLGGLLASAVTVIGSMLVPLRRLPIETTSGSSDAGTTPSG